MAFDTINERKELDAKVIVVAPRRFNTGNWSGLRHYSRLLSMDEANNCPQVVHFSVIKWVTFRLTNITLLGQSEGLSSLQTGMPVNLGYQRK